MLFYFEERLIAKLRIKKKKKHNTEKTNKNV